MNELVKRKQVVQQMMAKNELVTTSLLNELKQPQVLEQYYQKYCGVPEKYVIRPVVDYESVARKHTVQDFVSHFGTRYKVISKLLQTRQELSGLTSIARLEHTPDRQKVSIIAMVSSKNLTKNEHFMLEVEDRTGSLKVLISKTSPAYEQAKEIMLDEVIGISGTAGGDIIFADNFIYPDIPIRDEIRAPDEAYAAVISDIHCGSTHFQT